jgi:hypothetical protein
MPSRGTLTDAVSERPDRAGARVWPHVQRSRRLPQVGQRPA